MEAHGGDRETLDVSDHESSSFSEAPSMVGYRITRSKSRTRANFIPGEASRSLENNMCCPCDEEKESTFPKSWWTEEAFSTTMTQCRSNYVGEIDDRM